MEIWLLKVDSYFKKTQPSPGESITRVLQHENSSFGQAERNQIFPDENFQFWSNTASFGISKVFSFSLKTRVLGQNSSFGVLVTKLPAFMKTSSFDSSFNSSFDKTPVLTPVLGNPRASIFSQLENSSFG